MKLSSKPKSSPGRTEKFPPPLMTFLRSNVGNKSRGRSRSSPMFVRKKNTGIETQEPTSPKVTCMGQVRVRRSGSKPGRTPTPEKRRCRWIWNTLFCTHFQRPSLKHKSFRPTFRKWVLFFQGGFRRKSEAREDSTKIESKSEENDDGEDKENDGEEEDDKNFVCSSSTPPKNALLLTRCRSAPYRSSSLAFRFWGSPLLSEEPKPESENREEHKNPTLETEPICEDSPRTDGENEENLGFCKEIEGKRSTKSGTIEELKTGEVCSVGPLILTRCKSEPARTGAKLDPEDNFWRKRRLGLNDSFSANVCD